MDHPDLITWLVAKQQQLGMNEVQFIDFLGLGDLSTWMRYKTRVRPPTLRLMQMAADRWPKEQSDVFEAAKRSKVRSIKETAPSR